MQIREKLANDISKLAYKKMTFPQEEHATLKERLQEGKDIYTTRVLRERNKYRQGEVVVSPFGKLEVTNIFKNQGIDNHPHSSELTESWKNEIGDKRYDYIRLKALNKQASYAPNLNNLIHFTHEEDGQPLTRSISELYDRDPEKAKDILSGLVARRHRSPGYLPHRKAIEDYMRSRLPDLGITPGSNYPTYAVLDTGADPKLFAGEGKVILPLEVLKNKVTFTFGDSFPVLTHKIDPEAQVPSAPYGKGLLTYKVIKQLVEGGKLADRLERMHDVSLARGRKVPMDYVEAQIWEEPEKLLEIIRGYDDQKS